MSGFYISDKRIENYEKTNKYLSRRGEDKTITGQSDGFSYIYNVFLLKEDRDFFFKDDNYVIFLDGIIFNSEDKSFSGMNHFLVNLYEEYGTEFIKKIDGEFSICLIDFLKKIIVFSRDVFGTKPLWYSDNDGFAISSYKSSILANGKECVRAQTNTTYIMDFTGNIVDKITNFKMDLNQYKDSFDDWCSALELAIKKRIITDEIMGIGLSSGYDSGVVFSALKKHTDNFISMSYLGKETEDILYKRMAMHSNSVLLDYNENEFLVTLKELYRNCEPFNEEYFELLKDESSTGLAIMCKMLKKAKGKIYFSGIEYEIMPAVDVENGGRKHSDFDFEKISKQFPSDLSKIYPWRNKLGHVYLEREEYVCGCYGIQPTYPLYDTNLVQEFFWLSEKLKNSAYKAPVEAYFKKNNFPYKVEKAGFFIRNNDV